MITHGNLRPLTTFLKKNFPDYRLIVLTNPRVKRYCLPLLSQALRQKGWSYDTVIVPDGEVHKNLTTVARVYDQLLRLKADRKTLLLLLGGGVIGDLGGMVAATFLRGLPYIQLPTTVVGQVDASIGGKVGVDHPQGKNLIGAFYQPRAVFSEVSWLTTLSDRQFRAGLAEVVKYGVIRKPQILNYLDRHWDAIRKRDPVRLQWLVAESSAIKAAVVMADEKESHLRMILNFGHTLGHAVEKLMHYRGWFHGEAVAAGMVFAARLSARKGYCNVSVPVRLEAMLRRLRLPTELPPLPKKRYRQALLFDKKRRGDRLHFVCVRRMGQVFMRPMKIRDIIPG